MALSHVLRYYSRVMEVEISDVELEAMLEKDSGKFSPAVNAGFRKVVNFILAAANEHDFRAMRSLKFEKLKGKRSHQYSFRINEQWRLIAEIEQRNEGNLVRIQGIEDYHK